RSTLHSDIPCASWQVAGRSRRRTQPWERTEDSMRWRSRRSLTGGQSTTEKAWPLPPQERILGTVTPLQKPAGRIIKARRAHKPEHAPSNWDATHGPHLPGVADRG